MAFNQLSDALRQVGGLVVRRLSQGLQEDNAIASGRLDKSITFRAFSQDSIVGVNIEMEDYWQYVDEGRKPGKMPPVSKIAQWLTYPNVKEKIGARDTDNVEHLAYSIAKKIGTKGTKGNDFATNVFNSKLVNQEIPRLIEDSIGQDIELILDQAFNIKEQ